MLEGETVEYRAPAPLSFLGRRRFLLGLTAMAAGEVAGCRIPENPAPVYKDERIRLPERAEVVIDKPLEFIDRVYTNDLLLGLQTERGTAAERLRAVTDSLRLLKIKNYSGKTVGEATAFEIDESGIYLTARHIIQQKIMAVTDPRNGETCIVRGFIVHKEADMAIMYAPTGRPKNPADNLTLHTERPGHGEPLWMIGLFRMQDRTLHRMNEVGYVDDGADWTGTEQLPLAAKLGVRGMKPAGGTSGCPIVNARGAVVAIESGYYPDNADDYKDYQGSRVTPLVYAGSLARQRAYIAG